MPKPVYTFLGGVVCLDFVNTVAWRTTPEPQELLPHYRSPLATQETVGRA